MKAWERGAFITWTVILFLWLIFWAWVSEEEVFRGVSLYPVTIYYDKPPIFEQFLYTWIGIGAIAFFIASIIRAREREERIPQ